MLTLIRVKNYAVIDEAELELAAGFTVITGETGAGKSILVDALALVLGDRADASVVRLGADRAEISALFQCAADHPALDWLRERSFDDGEDCALRRVIGAEGRSKAFINGQPATLQDLRALGALLVDIHGQHAHQSLLESGAQRALLDAYGGLTADAVAVTAAYRAWQSFEADLAARRGSSAAREAELDLLRFQLAELERLNLAPGEPAMLQAERDRLANVDRLAGAIGEALNVLYEADTACAHALLAAARHALARAADYDASLRGHGEALAAAEIEVREVASSLAHYRDRLEADPERLAWLESRLAAVRALARKHAVADAELPEVIERLAARIAALDGGGASLANLQRAAEQAAAEFFNRAEALSAARAKHAARLGRRITTQLAELGMPDGELKVVLEPKPREQADGTGRERVEFLVRLNAGQGFGPLAKIASGGELSRISLAVEVVRSGGSPVETFVFDEVDAGIGGRVAEIVGRRLAELARDRQVLCVTHLPQVASQGRQHYRVVKSSDGKQSRTAVLELDAAGRVEELSRMLGGVEITERTRAHAAEMMARAAK